MLLVSAPFVVGRRMAIGLRRWAQPGGRRAPAGV